MKTIICRGKSMRKLSDFIDVGKPLLVAPTMDYHKTLWGLAFANTLIKDNKSVKYLNLYETSDEVNKVWEEYNWGFGCLATEDDVYKKVCNIDEIIDCIEDEKPNVVIIDCIDSRFNLVSNYTDFKQIFAKLESVSIKNNTAVVVISGKFPELGEKKELDDIDSYFSKMISIKDANMVEIKEIGL